MPFNGTCGRLTGEGGGGGGGGGRARGEGGCTQGAGGGERDDDQRQDRRKLPPEFWQADLGPSLWLLGLRGVVGHST